MSRLLLCYLLFMYLSHCTSQSIPSPVNSDASTKTTLPVTTSTPPVPITTSTLPPNTTTTSTAVPNTTTSTPPFPLVPQYQVKNNTNICLLVQMDLKFQVNYHTKDGSPATSFFFINESSSIRPMVTGICGNESETLRLEWWPVPAQLSWRLLMNFTKTPSGDHFSLRLVNFNFTLSEPLFPDINETFHMVHNESQFKCPVNSYWQCLTKQTLKLNKMFDVPTPVEVFLTVSNLKVQAFRSSVDPIFLGSMTECSADYVPNKVVPIVVGVALACMIVIALVAFIVASRRRQNGYQTI